MLIPLCLLCVAHEQEAIEFEANIHEEHYLPMYCICQYISLTDTRYLAIFRSLCPGANPDLIH